MRRSGRNYACHFQLPESRGLAPTSSLAVMVCGDGRPQRNRVEITWSNARDEQQYALRKPSAGFQNVCAARHKYFVSQSVSRSYQTVSNCSKRSAVRLVGIILAVRVQGVLLLQNSNKTALHWPVTLLGVRQQMSQSARLTYVAANLIADFSTPYQNGDHFL